MEKKTITLSEEHRKAFQCILKIYTGEYPFTWEQFLKCGIAIIDYNTRKMGGFKVYRASFIHDNEERIRFKSGFSYPPPNLTKMGRCNLGGHPVFYCSPSLVGSIYETILTRNDVNILQEYKYFIYVSEWEFPERKKYVVFDTNFYKALESETEDDFFITIYQNLICKIFTSKLGHDISANLSFNLMNGWKPEANKLITPPVSGPSEGGNCKLIIYPTVVKDGKFHNLAIHPSIINNNELKFNRVFKVFLPDNMDFNSLVNSYPIPFVILEQGELRSESGDEINWKEIIFEDYNTLNY